MGDKPPMTFEERIIVSVILVALTFFIAHYAGRQTVRFEAVENNHAHYEVDKYGTTTFVWNEVTQND